MEEIISMNSGGYEFDQTDHPETANTFGKMLDYILNLEITQSCGRSTVSQLESS